MKKRLAQIWERFLKEWGSEPTKAPSGEGKRQLLVFIRLDDEKRIHVGVLSHSKGEFVFRYTDDFRVAGLPPIPGLPDLEREYRCEYLWPVFQVRLPPQSRDDVARVIKEQQLTQEDPLELLRVLGRRAISSPYEIEPVGA